MFCRLTVPISQYDIIPSDPIPLSQVTILGASVLPSTIGGSWGAEVSGHGTASRSTLERIRLEDMYKIGVRMCENTVVCRHVRMGIRMYVVNERMKE